MVVMVAGNVVCRWKRNSMVDCCSTAKRWYLEVSVDSLIEKTGLDSWLRSKRIACIVGLVEAVVRYEVDFVAL